MSTNVEFKSNIYPIVGSLQFDKVFLSKIQDHSKLRGLKDKFFPLDSHSIWNEFQKKIIKERPTCSPSCDVFQDPCWGLVKSKGSYIWECKCVNTACGGFNDCRTTFDEIEYEMFSPVVNSLKGYSYEYSKVEQIVYPIADKDNIIFYGDFKEYSKKQRLSTKIIEKLPSKKAVVEIIEIIRQIEDEHITEAECTAEVVDQNLENVSGAKHDGEQIELISVTEGITDNIFEYFIEGEQEDVIKAPPKDVTFVDAGPGTGKTYTLIQKINYMVTEYDVAPDSILVLCFTNAAVDEIRDRLNEFIFKGGDRGLVNVDIRTFHSFAWWLIGQANGLFVDNGWQTVSMSNLSYDSSLSTASKVMSKFSSQIVDGWGHFIVDEVQDLTQNLAHFVLDVVNSCLTARCGITVMGDSCQAIYDYNKQNNSANPMTSEDFYKVLFRKIYGNAQFIKLSVNHRQTNELITLTAGLRESILKLNFPQMAIEASNILSGIKDIKKTALDIQIEELQLLSNYKKVCLLCRNNGQTLKLSSILRKQGIPHVLNAYETFQNFAPWISEVFFEYSKPTISYDKFEMLYEKAYSKDSIVLPQEVWSRIRKIMHSRNDVLVVSELLQAIESSKIDDSILRKSHKESIIVSNIHRVKGREYECVIIDKNFMDTLVSEEKEIGEYKTLYVAVTRPKTTLCVASLSKSNELRPITIYNSQRIRWGKTKNKKIVNFEIKSDLDIDIQSYLRQNQSYLANVHVGDPIELRRVLGNETVNYDIVHYKDDLPVIIGRLGDKYVKDLISFMQIHLSQFVEMPATIDDLYVSGIYSHISSEEYIKANPQISAISPNGIWKWVEFVGVGHASYDVY